MELIGAYGNRVLFADEVNAVIVDYRRNSVVKTGGRSALIASAAWDDDNTPEISNAVVDIAAAELSSLNVVVAEAGRMYTIPAGVQAEAKKALAWRREHHRGGTPVGLNTARTLADGGQIGIEKVRHIAKYFPRHEVDKKGKGWEPGEDNFPSNGRIAWALWGGDAGWRWARSIVERENKKAVRAAGGFSLADFADDIDSYEPAGYDASVDAFKLAYELDTDAFPEFVARVRMDGSGIDRLYMVNEDGSINVWDDGRWDAFVNVDSDVAAYDRSLDDPYDGVEKSYVVIDAPSAVIVSGHLQANPFQPVDILSISEDEALMFAVARNDLDLEFVDMVMVAAGEPSGSAGDGEYTPEERSKAVQSQVRDATGKFAKMGSKVSVTGTDKVGNITKIDPANQKIQVTFDDGQVADMPANSVSPYVPTATAPTSNTPPEVLDTSGILGQPRAVSATGPRLPGTLDPLTPSDINTLLSDWPSWVADQRAGYTPIDVPNTHVNTDAEDHKAPNAFNDPYLRNWLDQRQKSKGKTSYPNRQWYNPVRRDDVQAKRSAKSVGTQLSNDAGFVAAAAIALTPETSDVPPLYMAIVSSDDPRAVLDVVSLIPANTKSTEPTTFKRQEGKWVQDDTILADLRSSTPPPVVPLDSDTLADVLSQMDDIDDLQKESVDPSTMSVYSNLIDVFWNFDGNRTHVLTAAGGLDRNRGNAERLRRYWVHGKGAAKIRWGMPGDWSRCVRHLSKYMGVRAKGYCQLRHKEALGIYTSTHAKRDRARSNSADEFIMETPFDPLTMKPFTEVTDDDMKMPLDAIHITHDDLYDHHWEPDVEIVSLIKYLKDVDEASLLAAGGLDRNRGNAEKLRRYWTVGKGGLKIRWNTPGDWTRCVRHLSKYMGPRAKGYCALRHKEMTGMWTGDKAHRRDVANAFSFDGVLSEEAFMDKLYISARKNSIVERVITAGAGTVSTGAKFVIPLLLPEEIESGDGRMFKKDAITMRDLPIPLLWQIKTAEGHMGSVVVGRIDHMERTEQGIGNATGVFDTGAYGREAERLVREGFIRGVSADLDRFKAQQETSSEAGDGTEDDGKIQQEKMVISEARIMATTIVPKPAFQECRIQIVNDEDEKQEAEVIPDGVYVDDMDPIDAAALVACGMIAGVIPVTPPAEWFDNPKLEKATPLTVTDDGQVFGHIAAWHVDHIGMSYGTKPPRSRSNYAYFHTGVVRTLEGKDVPVGQLTLAGGHASLEASAAQAAKHYDDTASAIADVHAGEDAFGIWVAGSLRPSATPEQIRALRASAPSGDWRPIKGRLELVAVCQVNVPGFPVARARVASGQVMALVAAGAQALAKQKADPIAELNLRIEKLEELERKAIKDKMTELSARVKSGGDMKANTASVEDIKARFAAIKSSLTVESVVADGFGGGDYDGKSMCIECLTSLLAGVTNMYFKAHGFHWNVVGEDFAQYHDLFSDIYGDVYSSIDPLAENLRKLGAAAPSLADLARPDGTSASVGSPQQMAADLLVTNEELISELKAAFTVCDQADEQGIANFIADRIDQHQKWSWQLSASLVPEATIETAPSGENYDMFEAVFSTLEEEGLVASAHVYYDMFALDTETRQKLAKKGHALPDGSYPITDVDSLKKAIKAYGRSKPGDRAKVRRHIMKRARQLKQGDLIPEKWKGLKASGELSAQAAALRARVFADLGDQGKAPAAEVKDQQGYKYSAETQPRDERGKFRQVLARLKENVGESGLQNVVDKINETEKLDEAGNYIDASKAAGELLNLVDRIDTGALNPRALENVRSTAGELGKVIANLPLPFSDQNEKIRYSDLPPALRELIDDMLTRVESKIGTDDAKVATQALRSYKSGGDLYSQAEISSELSKMLRLLT